MYKTGLDDIKRYIQESASLHRATSRHVRVRNSSLKMVPLRTWPNPRRLYRAPRAIPLVCPNASRGQPHHLDGIIKRMGGEDADYQAAHGDGC